MAEKLKAQDKTIEELEDKVENLTDELNKTKNLLENCQHKCKTDTEAF